MCAINGFNFEDHDLLLRMNAATRHRGPDGTGAFLSPEMSLGHNRLKIIDLSDAASQPMKSDDGRFVIVFNGEIYNYRELRKELESEYHFHSASDTEVILASYKKWGKECLTHFSGMFAFALWDTREKELFLARDPVGIKPLYYFWDGTKIIFSSEIKGILEHPVPRVLEREAMNLYFQFLYVPSPLTLFKRIQKLPPGHSLSLLRGVLTVSKYADWKASPKDENLAESAASVKEAIDESVAEEIISDRPIGVYLSGGFDSNAVLQGLRSAVSGPIETFSIGFEVGSPKADEKFNADFHLAKKSAEFYGTKHHEVLLSTKEVRGLFEEAVWHMDEPIAVPTALSMLRLGRFAKERVAVVLGGNGGDELFGGYERYRLSRAASIFQTLPSAVRKIAARHPRLRKLNTSSGVERFLLFHSQEGEEISRSITPTFRNADAGRIFFSERYFSDMPKDIPFESYFMDVDRKTWIPDESLTLSDKMSMASGLELRVPMLNRRTVLSALSVPLRNKVRLFDKKIVLKEALRGHIPDFLFNQPKRGWFSPGSFWLRTEEMKPFVREVLSPKYYSETRGLFDFGYIEHLREDHTKRGGYHLNTLWALLSFQFWAKKYNVSLS